MNAQAVGLFETEPELERLLGWSRQQGTKLRLVALTPEADWAAESRGVPYQTIEELCSEEELLARGLQNFEVTEQLCAVFDRHLHAAAETVPWLQHFSLRYAFYHTKILLDALLHRTLTLKRALEILDPVTVVGFDPDARLRHDVLPRSVSALLLPVMASSMGVAMVSLQRPADLRQPCAEPLWKRVSQLAARVRRVQERLTPVSTGFEREGATLVLTGYWSDWEVLEAWVARGGRVMDQHEVSRQIAATSLRSFEASRLESVLETFWSTLSGDESARAFFRIDGVNLLPVIEQRLRELTLGLLRRYTRWAAAMDQIFDTVPDPVVFGSVFVSMEDIACAVVARLKSIPTVTSQHGGFIGYPDVPMLKFSEPQLSDYCLCYGEGVCEEIRRVVSGDIRQPDAPVTQPVAVGSASLDRLCARSQRLVHGRRARHPSRGRTVVYVPTLLMGDRRYFSRHIFPDIWYWRLQREVIRLCSRFPDVRLLVKRYPRDNVQNPIEAWIRHEGIRNCHVLRRAPLSDVLDQADLFIIDSPATTLLQALTTSKQILVYADHRYMRFHPEAVARLTARATFSTTRVEFLRDIERALHAPDWSLPEPIHTDFLRAYGTYLHDGGSAQRAVHVLRQVANRSGSPLATPCVEART